ncbi:MAG TPA: serine hydrolase [Anaerolineales bacterium]
MKNRNASILLRGSAIFLLIIATFLTISSLISYSRQRNNYPAGMTIAGVPVGGLDPQAASQRVLQIYTSPIELRYGDGIIHVEPSTLGFELEMDSMLAAADLSRTGGPFWGGFWDFLWNRNPTASSVPLRATIVEERLRAYLVGDVAARYDEPPTAAQPVPGTTTFAPGKPGRALDIDASVALIEDSLRSPSRRSVNLPSTENSVAARPSLANLDILLKQLVVQSGFDGTIGVYMLDLQNGQEVHFALDAGHEVSVDPDVAFTASSTIKIPILVSYFIQHGKDPVPEDVNQKILNMIHKSDNVASDSVMAELNPDTGPLVVTEQLKKLGFVNTFMAGFFYAGAPLLQRFTTPANQRTDVFTDPDIYNQTTPSEMGTLLEDVYQCAQTGGGALVAAYPEKMAQDVCQRIIEYLVADKIGVLLEAGVPEGTRVAHKHGWVPDTDGVVRNFSDAGIVYTPGGDFVLAIYAHHPVQVVFDTANQLFASITQAVYNYYNTAQ